MAPLTAAKKQYLNQLGLPSDADLIREARRFMLTVGFTIGEMADAVGMNPSSFGVWISGNYDKHDPHGDERNTLQVRAKIKEFLNQYEDSRDDFMSRPHYVTKDFTTLRKSILTALDQGVAFLVDGPPGTQKTHAFRRVAHEINTSGLGRAIYMRVRCEQSPQAFLMECCTRAGIPNRGLIDQLIRKLRFFLGKGRTVLIIDEAQALSKNGLEIVRQLLDEPPYFGVVLGGSHNLSVTLQHWTMEQWRSRLRKTHLLSGPTRDEAESILLAQLGGISRAVMQKAVEGAMTSTMRDGKTFEYISARVLFDAIKTTRAALDAQAKPSLVSAGGAA
jgi:DNA transposition AAA+ family ATPase